MRASPNANDKLKTTRIKTMNRFQCGCPRSLPLHVNDRQAQGRDGRYSLHTSTMNRRTRSQEMRHHDPSPRAIRKDSTEMTLQCSSSFHCKGPGRELPDQGSKTARRARSRLCTSSSRRRAAGCGSNGRSRSSADAQVGVPPPSASTSCRDESASAIPRAAARLAKPLGGLGGVYSSFPHRSSP